MALFKSLQQGVEVNGATIMSVIKGMGVYKNAALRILSDVGLEGVKDSANEWYSQQKWLDAFKIISEQTGVNTLYSIGKMIPESAKFPPEITTVKQALSSIDVAYHMNHRNVYGVVMFDPKSGKMSEGIGHYWFRPDENDENRAYITCDNPYPDDFDRGIISSIARRFTNGVVKVEYLEGSPSRKEGANKTTFVVSWN